MCTYVCSQKNGEIDGQRRWEKPYVLRKRRSPGLAPACHGILYCAWLQPRQKDNVQLTQGLVHAVIACNNKAGHAFKVYTHMHASRSWIAPSMHTYHAALPPSTCRWVGSLRVDWQRTRCMDEKGRPILRDAYGSPLTFASGNGDTLLAATVSASYR